MKKHFVSFLPYLFFILFAVIFARDIFLKNYVIGPFDFLVGFYHPYMDIKWHNEMLSNLALHHKNYLMSDVIMVVLPVKLLTINLIKTNILPLWNPYILNGTPLLANIQAAVLYPVNIFYFFLSFKQAYNAYILSQLFLGFVFMYLFLRSIKISAMYAYMGAFAFAFSSFFIGWLTWGTLGHAFVWLPLILFAIEHYFVKQHKVYIVLISLGLTMSLLAGHTQTTISLLIATLFYLAIKTVNSRSWKKSIHVSTGLLLAFGISALQLIPTAELYMQSVRESVSDINFFRGTTLNASSYFMAIFPDFFGNPVTRNWWGKINYAESALYFGAVAFYFSLYFLINPKRIKNEIYLFAGGLMLIGILLSTDNIISYLVYLAKIPVLSSGTFARYSVIFIVGGVIAAAYGFYLYVQDIKKEDYRVINMLNSLCTAVLLFFWLVLLIKMSPKSYLENASIIRRNMILPTLLIGFIIGASLFLQIMNRFLFIRRLKLKSIFPIFVLLLLSIETFRFVHKYMPFSPEVFIYPPHALLTKLQTLKDGRYYQYLPANVNSYYKISGIEGKEPLYNKYLGELASTGATGKIALGDRTGIMFPDGMYKARIFDLFSMKYVVDKTDNYRNSLENQYPGLFDSRYKEIWTDGIYKIYLNSKHVPRYGLYFNVIQEADKQKILARLLTQSFDPQKSVVVETNKKLPVASGSGTIRLSKETELFQQYTTTASGSALLAVTDTHYPGWNAYIDNKPTAILRTNYAFRGVVVPAGTHVVEFKYEPESMKAGLYISLFSLALLGLYVTPIKLIRKRT